MRFAKHDQVRLTQACEVLPISELTKGTPIIVDGRHLQPGHPLAWRAGTVALVEHLTWAKDRPLLPRVDLPSRASDGCRRREPVAPGMLLRHTPELLRTLKSLGLWTER